MAVTAKQKSQRRAGRTRSSIARKSRGRLRLSVFRSNKNIAAQVIDDKAGVTLASASSIETALAAEIGKGHDVAAAAKVGKIVAERALKAGIEEVVFDRGSYIYHGRVKALADAAREAGLKF